MPSSKKDVDITDLSYAIVTKFTEHDFALITWLVSNIDDLNTKKMYFPSKAIVTRNCCKLYLVAAMIRMIY